jgi:hypothetical protein
MGTETCRFLYSSLAVGVVKKENFPSAQEKVRPPVLVRSTWDWQKGEDVSSKVWSGISSLAADGLTWGVGTTAVSVGFGVGDTVPKEVVMLPTGVGVERENAENRMNPMISKNKGKCFFDKMIFFIISLSIQFNSDDIPLL